MLIVLRERGCLRIPLAVFMLVWLCGWAVGEVFAARMLRSMIESRIPVGVAFAGVWLALWSAGGAMSMVTLLRALAGRDELRIGAEAWQLRRAVGPFGFTRTLRTSDMHAVYLSRSGHLVAELADRDVRLTRYGTLAERQSIAARFPSKSGDDLPRRWRAVPHGDGRTRVEPRRFEGMGCLVVCIALAIAGAAMRIPQLAPVTIGTSILFGALAVWGAFSRRGWLAGNGSVSAWTSFPGWRREIVFDRETLAVTYRVDSDGDESFALVASAGGRTRPLHRDMNDDRTVLRLGRFLARQVGWTLRVDDYPSTSARNSL